MQDPGSDDTPNYTDVPVGLDASGMRSEFDSLGTVDVPAACYWGAQTQRSLTHFSIGDDHMPIEVYRAFGCGEFLEFSVRGTTLDTDRIARYVSESAEDAVVKGTTLREVAVSSGHVTAEQFDSVVDPLAMVGGGAGGA